MLVVPHRSDYQQRDRTQRARNEGSAVTVNRITELQGVVARDIRDLILRIFEPPRASSSMTFTRDLDMGSIVFTVTEQPSSEQLTVRITNTTGLIQSALLRAGVGSGRNAKSTLKRGARGPGKNPLPEPTATLGGDLRARSNRNRATL